jgi:hypothetical protein
MTATREHRNAGEIEEAVAAIGSAIEEAQALLERLAAALPDDYPYWEMEEALAKLQRAHHRAQMVALR